MAITNLARLLARRVQGPPAAARLLRQLTFPFRSFLQCTLRPVGTVGYCDIFGGDDDAETVAGQWLARFREHESDAVKEIINLVLRASGCQLAVTTEDVEDPDNCTNKLTDLQDEFQAEQQNVVEYPLIAKSRVAASFRKTLSAFLIAFIKTVAAEKILYESPELVENVQVWVSAMSSAANRPFRHTATVVSLDIITALAEVASDQIEAKARMLRQVEGEQKKARGGNKERIKSLQKEADAIGETKVTLDGLLRDWFETVFVHRYRDVDPKIRVDCLVSLAEWMNIYPDYFVDGEHLRYLGWCLSDISAQTRLTVLKGLGTIFRDDRKLGGLRQFTERFRARMVEMATSDADISVRTHSVELLDILREKGLLEPDDIDTVGKLVYDTEPRVRKAVVSFFTASVEESFDMKFEELGGQEAVDDGLPEENEDDYETPRVSWLRFKALAELLSAYDGDETSDVVEMQSADFLVSAGLESRYTIAAQAVLLELPVIKDWEVLAGMLLFDHSASTDNTGVAALLRQESKLNEREEVILLDVLNTLVKNTLTDVVEENAPAKKAKKTKAQIRELKEARDTASQHLAALIPKLLSKFGAAPDAAAAVLRLERLLNLEVFQELRQDSTAFSSLLENIRKQFTEHENQVVIAEASAALAHARSYEELEEITSGKMSALWEETCHSLASLCHGEELRVRGSMNASMANGVNNALLRIANLASISDPTEALEAPHTQKPRKSRRGAGAAKAQDRPSVTPINLILDLLLRGEPASGLTKDVDAIEDALTSNAIKSLFFYFLWHARALADADHPPSATALPTLIARRSTALSHLQRILRRRRAADDVRLAAAGLVLDLHAAFIRAAPLTNAALAPLAAPLAPDAEAQLVRALAAAEHDYARRAKRTLPAAADDDDDDALAADADADPEDSDDDADQDEGDADATGDAAPRHRALRAEQRLCTLAAKVVLALVAGCVEEPRFASGARRSSALRKRLLRHRARLGANYREICEKLEGGGEKGGKRKGGKGLPAMATAGVEGGGVEEDENEEVDVDEAEAEEARDAEEARLAAEREGKEERAGEGEDDGDSVVGD
ncbi:hypothetical protein FH972_022802 [Carpinus fangiana]|uniref:SCD domain-containing protein n=1 Tax=Carpinus fangiana TaxID=176857 RepID=A0A5N6KTM2_9ROSI|nr:hypothetical protein FH972_022802 [Carpinus fangiana]